MGLNQEVKERLENALAKYGISKAQASREMGYANSIVSMYTTGNYGGDVAKLEEAIVKWVARQEQAHSRKKIPVVETVSLRTTMRAIQMAHTERDIALIIADAGSGKTTAAKKYTAENGKTVVYIPVVSGMNRKQLVSEIARQLGIETARVQLNLLVQNCAEALRDMDSLVILDEADYLKADALEFVRRLVYDLGESGLVLIGLPRLRGMIQNLRNDHRQLESRIGISLQLEGLTKPDATMIARSVWPECGKDIVEAIYAVSRNDVRQFCKIIERTQNTMIKNNLKEPSVEAVEVASSLVLRRR